MLQENESAEKQEAAKIFFTKLAEKTGEPPGPVIALVRTAVQPAPWGSGYLVVREISGRDGGGGVLIYCFAYSYDHYDH